MNGASVSVLPVLDQSVTERSCSRITLLGPQLCSLTSSSSPSSPLSLSLLQLYQLLSFSLSVFLNLSPPLSSLAHCISSYYPPLSLSLAFFCCLSLSPPPPPLFSPYLSLYGKAVNRLLSPSFFLLSLCFLSLFKWLYELSSFTADEVINTTLAPGNHSALCIFLPMFFNTHYQASEVWVPE